jgi:hypothetical protein
MSQSVLEGPTLRGAGVIVGAAVLVALASVTTTAAHGLLDVRVALLFFGFIAVAEVIRVRLPGGREAAPIGAAASLAYVLLTKVGHNMQTFAAYQAIAVVACGVLAGALPLVAAGRQPDLGYMARRVLGTAVVALVFRLGYLEHGGYHDLGRHNQQNIFTSVLLGMVLLAGTADVLIAAVQRSGTDHSPFVPALRDELRAMAGIGVATGATGALIALACESMALWAVPVVCVPLLLAQLSFRRFAAIRATYQQTVRALSRVTEVAGYTGTGHAQRVCRLSLAIGRDLGMDERSLLDLEYAALMHDIGQLSLKDPIPDGATIMVSPYEARRIAALGAEVIRQTGVLDTVADLVNRQADDLGDVHPMAPLNYGEAADTVESTDSTGSESGSGAGAGSGAAKGSPPAPAEVPLGSRIIRVANAYDDLVRGSLESASRQHALEQLRLHVGNAYDARVVDALSRTVERFSRYLL